MKLIERRTGDANFAHTCSLLGPIAAWAEALESGHVLEHNDLNMITIPIEVALAFLEEHRDAEGELGDAARTARDLLARFRSVTRARRRKRKTAVAEPATEPAS